VDPVVRHGPKVALAVVLGGFLLRLRGVAEYWLNPDEGIYYSTLTRDSLGAFWAEVSANAHPPLFYLLLRAMGTLTWDFVWLRGLSLLCGTLAIWGFWLVGRELGGKGRAGVVAGLVSAGLLAVNAEAITLSQVMRPYMMLLALLAFALYHLLRYRSDASPRRVALYTGSVVGALLIHYSAVLALACFVAVVGWYALAGTLSRADWRRLAIAQLAPALVFALLYVRHVASTIESDLMGDALGAGGWLSPWLVGSAGDAWFSFTTYQVFHLPPDFRGRAALLLLTALGAALVRDRLVAVIVGTGLGAALAASILGVYPFGPTRHDAWLVVFTLPAFGWLAGHVLERGVTASRVAAVVLVVALVAGGPIESVFGADLALTNATEEKVFRRSDLAGLVVGQLDPEQEPHTILMSEQSYNLLVPLYADGRQDERLSADSSVFVFSYGRRRIVVARRWDWSGLGELAETLRAAESLGGAEDASGDVLVVAGGWGSGLFSQVAALRSQGAVRQAVPVIGQDPAGNPIVRMMGIVLARAAIEEAA